MDRVAEQIISSPSALAAQSAAPDETHRRGRAIGAYAVSALPWLIIAGLLWAGLFVKPQPVGVSLQPPVLERRDHYYGLAAVEGALLAAGSDGKILRVVSGVGEGMRLHETHPDTGATLIGYVLPGWGRVTQLCLAAAKAFPGVRTQSWDVALTPAGPVLLEVNFGGDLNLHQIAHRRGALTETYAAHLKRCGYREL